MKKTGLVSSLFIGIGLVAALGWLLAGRGTIAHAASFTVNSTIDAVDANPGDGNCTTSSGDCTLRAAIQEANALTGDDTITLPAGTYTLTIAGVDEDSAATGDLDITDNLIINGSAANTTIIDANSIDRVFQVFAATTLQNVTIQNGQGYDSTIFSCGGGGIRHNSGTLTITDSRIANNTTTQSGGGICSFTSSDILIMNSTIDGNSAVVDGGGIDMNIPSNLSLVNSTISNNTAYRGAGINFQIGQAARTLSLETSQIISNTATERGGGVYFSAFSPSDSARLDIVASVFRGNQIPNHGNSSGAGLAIDGSNNMITIRDSAFRNNTSGAYSGGGIANWSDDTTISLIGDTFDGNAASGSHGGAYWSSADNVTLNITDSAFTNNSANQYGGAIYTNNFTDTVSITNTQFISNIVSLANGGGGGIYFASPAGYLGLTGSIFQNNQATGIPSFGGAVTIESSQATADIVNTVFSSNSAFQGGGFVNFAVAGIINITGSQFNSNSATGSGGGISHAADSSEMNITGTVFSGNSARNGAGIGAVADAVLTITNSTLSGNQATGEGGGIDNSRGVVTVNNATIVNNTADSDSNGSGDGGGIFTDGGTLNIANSIVAGNVDNGNEAPDCSSVAGTIVSAGYNLVSKTDGCNWSATAGDQLGTIASPIDPLLDTLTGSPAYYPLLENSPAIDAGNPAAPGSGFPACAATDQPGTARPFDGNGDGTAVCDIGAYEWANLEYVYLPLIVK